MKVATLSACSFPSMLMFIWDSTKCCPFPMNGKRDKLLDNRNQRNSSQTVIKHLITFEIWENGGLVQGIKANSYNMLLLEQSFNSATKVEEQRRSLRERVQSRRTVVATTPSPFLEPSVNACINSAWMQRWERNKAFKRVGWCILAKDDITYIFVEGYTHGAQK